MCISVFTCWLVYPVNAFHSVHSYCVHVKLCSSHYSLYYVYLPRMPRGVWIAQWQNATLVIEKMWVWVPPGVAGELSSPWSTFCADLFKYPFHPCVTTVAHERSRSFCQECRWQVAPQHTCTTHLWLQIKWPCKLVHGCMVYTEYALRQQQFHVAPVM